MTKMNFRTGFSTSHRRLPFCPLPTKFSPPVRLQYSLFGESDQYECPKWYEDVAALTAEIARVRAENEALERETEVARLKAELVTLQQRNAQLQKQKQPQPSSNPTIAVVVVVVVVD